MEFETKKSNEKAGLIAFQNESHFYFIAKSYEGNSPVVQLNKGFENGAELLASEKLSSSEKAVEFKVEFDKDTYRFYYKTGSEWKNLGGELDGKYLSTRVAGGFVGTNLGMYTTSQGEASDNEAVFDWFEYSGNDEVYQKNQGN